MAHVPPGNVPLRVAVRVRPRLRRDARNGTDTIAADECRVMVGGNDAFTFLQAFGPEATQRAVYNYCAAPQVAAVLDGLDACVFAFGQTGAGKTFSMLGPEGGHSSTQDGLVPLAAAEIFCAMARLEAEDQRCQHRLSATFVEIHREGLFDLLTPKRSKLTVRETDEDGAFSEGAARLRIRSVPALLAAVAEGSSRRRTAATSVHAHSSRSHALLSLTLEKRWRTGILEGGVEEAGHRVACRTSTLRLVDLAGSEGLTAWSGAHAKASADGIATNLGLHVLGRCLTALAKSEPHVPFRDSTLTRLLKPALCGRCQTVMLACVAPSEENAAESARVLRYATEAQKLTAAPQPRVTEEVELDPMATDVADDDAVLQRRCVWLQVPGFGAVFARVAGAPTEPLVLYVHGSGPENSGVTWTRCMSDTARRLHAATGRAYHHVAIDCPGYGRSPGDRQTIRSYPGAFLTAVVRATGHARAAALVGSSQGAAAIFNAALETPKIAERLAVCHPVGHAVERYAAILQPTLLAFDVQDDGHPVSVGRRMRQALPRSFYFEFGDEAAGWLEAHFADELVKLLVQQASPWPKHRGKELPELARLAGGLRVWSTPLQGEYGPWYRPLAPETSEPMPTGYEAAPLAAAPPQQQQDGEQEEEEELFSGSEVSDEDEAEAAEARAAAAALRRERAQAKCELCRGSLGPRPVRLLACRHALCECCVLRHPYLLGECPVCAAPAERSGTKKVVGLPSSDPESVTPQVASSSALAEEAEAAAGTLKAAADAALLIEYGNEARPAGGKTAYTTFVRVLRKGKAGSDIKRVSFNINPSFDRPTATVDRANDPKLGFAFEYAMAREYPCFMRVEFVEGPPLTIEYLVSSPDDGSSRVARRLAIAPATRKAKKKGLTVDVTEGARSTWVTASRE